jgi:glycosyltransferase involved in cell wall biosynthesis/ubiquinone/menaquinone biosynthesis C-methylase UbiE
MRILKVTQAYYPFLDRGGPAIKVRSIARALVAQGHQVTILTADLGFGSAEMASAAPVQHGWGWRSEVEGVETIYLTTRGRYRHLTVNPGVMGFCRRRLREFDLVHVYGLYDALGPVVAGYCRRYGIPYFVEPLGMTRPIDRGFLLKKVWSRLSNGYLRGASRMVATSELERAELLAEGFPHDRVLLRYNGIDLEEFRQLPPPGAFRKKAGLGDDERFVLFLGRLIPRKGADLLIEAVPHMDGDKTKLIIAGPEGEAGYLTFLRGKAWALGVEHRVLFTGPLYGEDKKAALADSSVFALPSRYENFGNAAAEAIACGTPAVVSDHCGIAPLISQRAGLVISYDSGVVARAVRALLENASLYQRLKAGCPQVADEISWGKLVRGMQDSYEAARSHHPGVRRQKAERRKQKAEARTKNEELQEVRSKRQEPTFYDAHPFDWTRGYNQRELDATLAPPLKSFLDEVPSDALVLDVGCGPGRVTACLAARRLRCVGIDVSRSSVRLMRERTGRAGVVADGLRLPFADGSVDRVIADGVIHHTSQPFAVFAESCRVLKSGGLFYAAVYKPGGRYQKLYRFPGSLIRRLVRYGPGRALIHSTLLPIYYLAHLVKSRGRRSWHGSKNLFYDYFITPVVEFLSRDELELWSERYGVDIVDYNPNHGLNVHSFFLRKAARAAPVGESAIHNLAPASPTFDRRSPPPPVAPTTPIPAAVAQEACPDLSVSRP